MLSKEEIRKHYIFSTNHELDNDNKMIKEYIEQLENENKQLKIAYKLMENEAMKDGAETIEQLEIKNQKLIEKLEEDIRNIERRK